MAEKTLSEQLAQEAYVVCNLKASRGEIGQRECYNAMATVLGEIGKRFVEASQELSASYRRMGPVRELPKVKIGAKLYYQDDRLEEFRNVDNPHDRITYKEHFKERKREIDVSGI